jgi:hypothetical protein
MNKCKCLQSCSSNDGSFEFKSERFYNFDYVPSNGLSSPFYRVFYNDNSTESFSFHIFHKFFKKY